MKLDLKKVVTATMAGGDFAKHLTRFRSASAEAIQEQLDLVVQRFPADTPDAAVAAGVGSSSNNPHYTMRSCLEHVRMVLTQAVEDLDENIIIEHRKAMKALKAKHEMALEQSRKASSVQISNTLAAREAAQRESLRLSDAGGSVVSEIEPVGGVEEAEQCMERQLATVTAQLSAKEAELTELHGQLLSLEEARGRLQSEAEALLERLRQSAEREGAVGEERARRVAELEAALEALSAAHEQATERLRQDADGLHEALEEAAVDATRAAVSSADECQRRVSELAARLRIALEAASLGSSDAREGRAARLRDELQTTHERVRSHWLPPQSTVAGLEMHLDGPWWLLMTFDGL